MSSTAEPIEEGILLTADEMLELYAREVRQLYDMSLEEYRAAKVTGTLPDRPRAAVTALEMMSGEGIRPRSEGRSTAVSEDPATYG
jgi:hypothetical protein